MGICKERSDIKAGGNRMRSSKLLIFSLLFGVFASACLSTPETATKSPKPNSNSNSNSNSTAAAVTSQNADPNAGVANSGQAVNLRDRWNLGKKKMIDTNPTGTPLPLQFRPAAENSESAVTMNRDGSVTEIRIFKSDHTLAKVEATSSGTKEKQVKFYLRSGKVIEVKTDRMGDLSTSTIAQLLAIAGTK